MTLACRGLAFSSSSCSRTFHHPVALLSLAYKHSVCSKLHFSLWTSNSAVLLQGHTVTLLLSCLVVSIGCLLVSEHSLALGTTLGLKLWVLAHGRHFHLWLAFLCSALLSSRGKLVIFLCVEYRLPALHEPPAPLCQFHLVQVFFFLQKGVSKLWCLC